MRWCASHSQRCLSCFRQASSESKRAASPGKRADRQYSTSDESRPGERQAWTCSVSRTSQAGHNAFSRWRATMRWLRMRLNALSRIESKS